MSNALMSLATQSLVLLAIFTSFTHATFYTNTSCSSTNTSSPSSSSIAPSYHIPFYPPHSSSSLSRLPPYPTSSSTPAISFYSTARPFSYPSKSSQSSLATSHALNNSRPFVGPCTVNVPSAGLNWWYNTSIYYAERTIQYEFTEPANTTPYATAFTNYPNPTPQLNITSYFSHRHSSYSTSKYYNSTSNRTSTTFYSFPIVPPHAPATTTIVETDYSSSIPSTSRFKSGDVYDYTTFFTPVGPATTALAVSGYTATITVPFLRFQQYEVEGASPTFVNGKRTVTTVTSTYDLPFTQGYGLSSYNFDGVVTASGNVPSDFRTVVGQPFCQAGIWKAVPTVIVVIVDDLVAAAALAVSQTVYSSAPAPVPAAATASVVHSTKSAGSFQFTAGLPLTIAPQGSLQVPSPVPVATSFATGTIICQGDACGIVVPNSANNGDVVTATSVESLATPIVVPGPGRPGVTSLPAVAPPVSQPASVGGAVSTPIPTPPPQPITSPVPQGPVTSYDVNPLISLLGGLGGQQPLITGGSGSGQGGGSGSGSGSGYGNQNAKNGASPPVITINGQTYTARVGDGGFIIGGQTLTPGGVVTAGNGQTIGLSGNGMQIVVNGQTSAIQGASPVPVITVGGQRYTAGSGNAYTINGQTLTPGGTIVVSGTTISLSPSGTAAVIGGTTQSILGAITSAPGLLSIGSRTFTPGPSSFYTIDGQTLTPGGVITVNGTRVSLSPGATSAVVGTTTEQLAGPVTSNSIVVANGASVSASPASAIPSFAPVITSSVGPGNKPAPTSHKGAASHIVDSPFLLTSCSLLSIFIGGIFVI